MLTIRRDQMEIFSRARAARFRASLLQEIVPLLGNRPLDHSALHNALEHRIGDAKRFGLETEAHIARFVRLILVIYPTSTRPLPLAAQAILSSYGLPPQIKLDRLEHWLLQRIRPAYGS